MQAVKIIEATDNSPRIELDAERGIITLEGKSYPENTFAFYKPVLEWIEDYFDEYTMGTVIDIKLSYFNSATTQVLYEILDIVNEHRSQVREVNWYYSDEDDIEDYEDYAEEFPDLHIHAVVATKDA